jgi:hypothetical protein
MSGSNTITGPTTGADSLSNSGLQSGLTAVQGQQNLNELQMYQFSAQASFEQSMTQTLGGLAMDAAKAKPQV